MYRIIGADGREYGPVPRDVLRQWIAEGRANGDTRTHVEGAPDWKPLRAIPEFAHLFVSQSHAPPPFAPPSMGPARKTNSNAVIGLVFAILSFTLGLCCCYGLPFSVIGLIFSLIGFSQINENPQVHEGRGIAIAGIAISALNLAMTVGLSLFAGFFHAWGRFGHHVYRL